MARAATSSQSIWGSQGADTFSADVTTETVRRDSWGAELIGGIALTLLGVAIVFFPVATFSSLVFFAGAFVLTLGVVDIFRGIFTIGRNWAWVGSILLGIISVAIGVIVLRFPVLSALSYLYLLGFYLLMWGIIKLFLPQPTSELGALNTFGAIFTMLLGVALLYNPLTGALTFYWLAGILALIAGPVQIALSIRMKHAARNGLRRLAPA